MTPSLKHVPRVYAFLESRQLGVAWVAAVCLGTLVISSSSGISPQRLIIPVLIMLVYGVFVFNRWSGLFASASQAYKLSIVGQLADSMYFMGFVWTLWALIDSFVIHQLETADAIFRTFGYALVTTAAGMFCRLAILQFKYTATEQTHDAQESVEELLLKFSSSLEATRQMLEKWHVTLTAGAFSIETANTGLITTIEHVRNEIGTTIAAATNSYIGMLTTTQTRFEQTIGQTGADLKTTLRDAVGGGLSDFGRQTAGNLDQIREATTGLVATLKRTNTSLGKSIFDLTDRVSEVAGKMKDVPEAIATGTQQIGVVLNDTATTLTAAAMTLSSTMSKTSESVISSTTAMTNGMSGLADEIKRDITLGLEGITVTPAVSVSIDGSILTNAMGPMQARLQHIGSQAAAIQQSLDALPKTTPSADEIIGGVDKIVQAAMATISGRLQRLEADVLDVQKQLVKEERPERRPWFFGQR